MTPATDLVACDKCHGLFAAASADDIFYHATGRCRRDMPKNAPVPVAEKR